MARVEKDIVVHVPVTTAYNQWTQFEAYPRFMEGVKEVRQLDNRRVYWRAEIAGHEKEWEAEIREQRPNERIVWNSVGGETAGMVSFAPEDAESTRVHLEMSYEPEGATESVGDALGFVSRQVGSDLDHFKEFIESRQVETGAWRGSIDNPDAPAGRTAGNTGIDDLDRGRDGADRSDTLRDRERLEDSSPSEGRVVPEDSPMSGLNRERDESREPDASWEEGRYTGQAGDRERRPEDRI